MSSQFIAFSDLHSVQLYRYETKLGRRKLHDQASLPAPSPDLIGLIDSVISALPAQGAPHRLRLVLQHEQVRVFAVTPPAMARRVADLRAAAELRKKQLFPAGDGPWRINARWHPSDPFFATALPEKVAQHLEALVHQGVVSSIAIEPWEWRTWQTARKSLRHDGWLLNIHMGRVTVMVCAKGKLALLVRLPATEATLAVSSIVQSIAIRHECPLPAHVVLLTDGSLSIDPGQAATLEVTTIKAIPSGLLAGEPWFAFQTEQRRLRWLPSPSAGAALLATGLLAGVALSQAEAQYRQAKQYEKQAQAILASAQTRSKQPAVQPPLTAASINAIKERNLATRRLNLPWPQVFLTLEDATPVTIALTSISANAEGDAIEGVAEAANPENMLDYVSALQRMPLLSSVELIQHEINTQDPYRPYRFAFKAMLHGADHEP